MTDARKEAYEKYLQSPAWRRRRDAALKRADHRCQVCNSRKRLDVHHRTYARFEEERAADLTVLCRRCHDLFHGNATLKSEAKKAPKKKSKASNQQEQYRKRRKRQRRSAKRWAERPSTTARRQELAKKTLEEVREEST